MVRKVLPLSLILILTISMVTFGALKKSEGEASVQKQEIVQMLRKTSQADFLKVARRSSVINVSDFNRSKERVKKIGECQKAIPIQDYYGWDPVVNGIAEPMVKSSPGTVIGTTTFTYGMAYQGRNVAVGNDGSIHVVWCDAGTPSNVTLYAKSLDQGATWSTPAVINDGYYGYKPAIAVDPNDPTKIHVAFVGYLNSGETRTVRYTKSEDGGDTWGASVLLTGSQVNTNNPDIDVDSQGNPHCAFDSYADVYIRYNYSSDGGTTWFAEPEVINEGFGGATFGASLAIDKNDNPHAFFGGGGADGSWGDKGTYWNWRDMASGTWQEVPPVELSPEGTGTPYPSMVFDSQGVGHCFYDAAGSTGQRGLWYRQYDPNTGWGAATEVPPSSPGTSVMEGQVGIDQDDNLFLGYLDGVGGGMNLEPSEGDFFVGTNLSGTWQYTNVSGNGPNVYEYHVNVARRIYNTDSLMHCGFLMGPGPCDVVYELGFPWPPNPKCGVNQLPDTYDETGPFSVTATTSDLDGTVVGCSLFVSLNGAKVDSMEMVSTAPDVWEADFTVAGATGDEVSYMAVATDNDGLEGASFLTIFDILEPDNPGADLLLVGDDMRLNEIYYEVLDDLGYTYEYWDIDAHAGIDASVTGWGWGTIIVAGWGLGSVPTRDYTDDPYASFLDNGGNLAIMSMDWFFGVGETETDLTFAPGDFAYDYMQIGNAQNDPATKDSLLIGIDGDAISTDWSVNPLVLNATTSGLDNWIDYTVATGNGVDCFYAYNVGEGCGVHHDAGTYKTLFLPFMFSWMVDSLNGGLVATDDAYTLMENVLGFFGTKSPPVISSVTGPRYGVYGYGPFDVTVEAVDLVKAVSPKSVTGMQLGYMVDDAADYTWIDLTASNGTYTGQIPQLTQDDTTVVYVAKATDDDGLSGLSMMYQFWTTGMEATAGVDLLYCGDDYYTWYYGGNVDSIARTALDANSLTYDIWDVDVYGPPDCGSVLSNYDHVIWHGYADWDPSVFPIATADNPFYPYLMNGGNLLFSSEEMLGTLYDWPDDYTPGPGEAIYDVLNTSWLGSDWGWDTVRVSSKSEQLCAGMDSILTLEEMPFGFMADMIDPVNVDAFVFDPYLDDYGAWYSDFGDYGCTWRYYNPATTSRVINMGILIVNLDETNRNAFIKNVMDYFNEADPGVHVEHPAETLPKSFALYHNFPNPFNPETSIGYDLPKDGNLTLIVYNIMGQKIRTLVDGRKMAGRYQAVWDGTNDAGLEMASGIYVFTIQAGDYVKSHKMMLLK